MRTISVRLDDRTDATLLAHCQRHGLTQTNAVKAAIKQLAATHTPTPAELAKELGLIGAFRSGVSDLASNRAHYIRSKLLAKRARESVPEP
jgi:hypothetical protein